MRESRTIKHVKTKNKSLSRWLFTLIVGGASLMCLIIIIISMVLYMRSVRRIYKTEMLKYADSAIEQASYDKVLSLCLNSSASGSVQETDTENLQEIFRQICESNDLTGLDLYSFDESTMSGMLLLSAYPNDASPESNISFSRIELNRMLRSEAGIKQLDKRSDGGYNSAVFKDIRDDAGNIVGLIKVSMSLSETLEARIRFFAIYAPVFIVLIAVLALLASKSIKKRVVNPLIELSRAARYLGAQDPEHLGEIGQKSFSAPENIPSDEIGELWKTCSDMEQTLGESISDLKALTAEKERQEAEVDIAFQIQTGMLPADNNELTMRKEFSISGSMTAAKGVAGDFYDYFLIDDDHLALVIGDVSGKGIPASLFMVLSMTQIRMQSYGIIHPSEILKRANNAICANNPEMMFVTVWMGILEISTGILRESNAGHEYPAIKHAQGLYELDLSEHDMPLGLMEDMEITEIERNLSADDRIFVYSDGLPESMNSSDEQLGNERMITALNQNPESEDKVLLEAMRAAVSDFVKEAPQFDDLTMLSFTFQGM